MNKLTLKVEPRKVTGRKVKNLRNEGTLPANIYGKKVKSTSIQIKEEEFSKVFKEAGETGLVELIINGSKRPVLVHNVQVDPVSDKPLHVDFLQVDLKQKVSAQVPVELTGESPAEKQGLGTVVQYINEIEVEALPSDLPDKFEIDLTKLTDVDQAILVKDLAVDQSKIDVKTDSEQIIIKVEPPKVEEEVVAPPTEEAPVEGEVPSAEGAETPPQEEAQQEKPEEA